MCEQWQKQRDSARKKKSEYKLNGTSLKFLVIFISSMMLCFCRMLLHQIRFVCTIPFALSLSSALWLGLKREVDIRCEHAVICVPFRDSKAHNGRLELNILAIYLLFLNRAKWILTHTKKRTQEKWMESCEKWNSWNGHGQKGQRRKLMSDGKSTFFSLSLSFLLLLIVSNVHCQFIRA